MDNAIIIVILILIVCFSSLYIYKAKKSGKKCIGCPEGCSCSAKDKAGCCGCGGTENQVFHG